jgi:DNA-binding transcriptional ArsR family regulator
MATAKSMTSSKRDQAERRLRMLQRATCLLKQVSNATRIRLILVLSQGARHVGALCEEVSQGQPIVSQHLSMLRICGIVSVRRRRNFNFYELTETGEELAKIVRAVIA